MASKRKVGNTITAKREQDLSQTFDMNTESLIKKWLPSIEKGRHVFTWSGDGELAYLSELASNSTLAAEFGVYLGASSIAMLNANPKLHLWTCDPFMVAGTRQCAEYFLRNFIASGNCEIITKHSREASDQLSHMQGRLDYVFLDDGHALADVLLDIECWLPLVRLGGMLCGHDYDQNPDNEVAQAVKQKLPGHFLPVPRLWAYIKR